MVTALGERAIEVETSGASRALLRHNNVASAALTPVAAQVARAAVANRAERACIGAYAAAVRVADARTSKAFARSARYATVRVVPATKASAAVEVIATAPALFWRRAGAAMYAVVGVGGDTVVGTPSSRAPGRSTWGSGRVMFTTAGRI